MDKVPSYFNNFSTNTDGTHNLFQYGCIILCLHLSTAYFKKLYYLLITLSKTLSKLYFGGVT